eukprot:scaffold194613_cov14-Prasinocladus_malaysianus.AAC.1
MSARVSTTLGRPRHIGRITAHLSYMSSPYKHKPNVCMSCTRNFGQRNNKAIRGNEFRCRAVAQVPAVKG